MHSSCKDIPTKTSNIIFFLPETVTSLRLCSAHARNVKIWRVTKFTVEIRCPKDHFKFKKSSLGHYWIWMQSVCPKIFQINPWNANVSPKYCSWDLFVKLIQLTMVFEVNLVIIIYWLHLHLPCGQKNWQFFNFPHWFYVQFFTIICQNLEVKAAYQKLVNCKRG